MKISVVTVVRNDPSVVETLASVLAQKGVQVESLVIDGASTDGTLRALAPFKRRCRVVSAKDKGIYDAMNKGLRLAKGQVVGFLNAGDRFESSGSLAKVAEAFKVFKDLDAVWSGLKIVSAEGALRRTWPAQAYSPGAFSLGWMPSHPTFYARRGRLLELKGFDLRYSLAADYDLMLRGLELMGWKGRALPGTLVQMRSGGSSQRSLSAWWDHNREAWRAAQSAQVTNASFLRFLALKAGRKLSQFHWKGRP